MVPGNSTNLNFLENWEENGNIETNKKQQEKQNHSLAFINHYNGERDSKFSI